MNLKLIIMAVGAFVIGLGGSTAAVVMRTPAKSAVSAAAADSLARLAHADSLAHTTTPGTTPPGTTPPAATAAAPDAASHATTPPATGAVAAALAATRPGVAPTEIVAESPVHGVEATLETETPAGYRQVARVLSSMKPADAAKIVAYLTDDQVEGILGQLGVRQAASLMTQLPTERAAALSRRIMQHTEAK